MAECDFALVSTSLIATRLDGNFQSVHVVSTDRKWTGRPSLTVQVVVGYGRATKTSACVECYSLDFGRLHGLPSRGFNLVGQRVVSLGTAGAQCFQSNHRQLHKPVVVSQEPEPLQSFGHFKRWHEAPP